MNLIREKTMHISGINSPLWMAKQQNRQVLPNNPVPVMTVPEKSAETNLASAPQNKGPDAAQEFMNYMKMTPAERMQESWLRQHGISKEEFDAMSVEEQQKIIAQMKQDIENDIKEKMRMAEHKPVNILA